MMRPHHRQRGVSLIEAIVALGVMAFGMMALIGVQATLRSGGDLARQRTEAMRIAQETMEGYRAYAAMNSTAGATDFDEIVTLARAAVDVGGTAMEGRLNTTFYRTVTAPALTHSSPMQPVAVSVDWTDRGGQFQSVELRSLISGVPPELPGSLALPAAHDPFAAPRARHRAIPLSAMTLPGVGLSVFKPPQRAGGTVAWVFNNATGLVTGVCNLDESRTTETITATDIANCSANTTAQLISGHVRFAAGDPANDAESPAGYALNLNMDLDLSSNHPSSPDCFDDAPRIGLVTNRHEVSYYCLIYSNTARTWAGRLRVEPRAFSSSSEWNIGSSGSANYKVCRYTPLTADEGANNTDHPLDYTANGSPAGASLANQNFLVISAAFSCPSETPTADDLFNSNTRLHQDGTSAYDNP